MIVFKNHPLLTLLMDRISSKGLDHGGLEYVATHGPSYHNRILGLEVAASVSQYMLPSATSLRVTDQEG